MLSDTQLLRMLQEYKRDEMNEEQINKIRWLLNKDKETFEGENMKQVSKAGYGLLQWVLAMVKYYEVAKLQQKKELAEENLPRIKQEMGIQQAEVASEANSKACKAWSSLSRADIQELKSLCKPPFEVAEVCSVVAFLLGHTKSKIDWKGAQAMMSNPGTFLDELGTFNAEDISQDVLSKCEPIMAQHFFNVEVMKKKSHAAAGLTDWVLNVVAFNKIYKRMTPLELVESASHALDQAIHDLSGMDLSGLKSMTAPPAGIKHVMEALCTMLQKQLDGRNDPDACKTIKDSRKPSRKELLADARFLDKLLNHDKDCISEETIGVIVRHVNLQDLHPVQIKKAVCMWCRAIYKYHRAVVAAREATSEAELLKTSKQVDSPEQDLKEIESQQEETDPSEVEFTVLEEISRSCSHYY